MKSAFRRLKYFPERNLQISSLRSESDSWRGSAKKTFLNVTQNSQENTSARVSFFNKVTGLMSPALLKKRLRHGYFPGIFAKKKKNYNTFNLHLTYLLFQTPLVWFAWVSDQLHHILLLNVLIPHRSERETFTCSKSTTETLEKDKKYVQN